jgi:hypothetical protein
MHLGYIIFLFLNIFFKPEQLCEIMFYVLFYNYVFSPKNAANIYRKYVLYLHKINE